MNQKIETKRLTVSNVRSLIDLKNLCPIDLTLVLYYARRFKTESSFSFDIDLGKEDLSNARRYLDLMVNSLISLLYDRMLTKKEHERYYLEEMSSNIRRTVSSLNSIETTMLEFDRRKNGNNWIGISTLLNYQRKMETIVLILLDSLKKATVEYHNYEGKIEKNARTFMYILFKLTSINFNIFSAGGTTETNIYKKGAIQQVSSLPWDTSLTPEGQTIIKNRYMKEIEGTVTKKDEQKELKEEIEKIDRIGESLDINDLFGGKNGLN